MTEQLIGAVLTIAIMLYGFWIMVSSVLPKRAPGSRVVHIHRGEGCLVRLLNGLFFSVLFPVVWRLIALFGTFYHRSFVVLTEFASGVHDWPTYRTSTYKYAGILAAFIGFNLTILSALLLAFIALPQLSLSIALKEGASSPPMGTSLSESVWLAVAITSGTALVAWSGTRFFLRRMP